MFGAYEMNGLLEAQYGPYESFARRRRDIAFGDAAQPRFADDLLTATRKAACVAMNNVWDDATKTCLTQPGGPPVDPLEQACKSSNLGWVWDPVLKRCLPPGSTPTPPPEDKGLSTTAMVAIGLAVIGGIYLLSRKKR